MDELGLAPVAPSHPVDGGKGKAGVGAPSSLAADSDDLYLKLKRAQRQLEMLEIQVSNTMPRLVCCGGWNAG
jgi:hypothetical protein